MDALARADRLWGNLRSSGSIYAQNFSTVRDMKNASDVVALGTVESIAVIATQRGPDRVQVAPDQPVVEIETTYAGLAFRVKDVIKGDIARGSTVTISEVLSSGLPGQAEGIVRTAGREMPSTDTLVFLKRGGLPPGDTRQTFIFINDQAAWAPSSRFPIDQVMSVELPFRTQYLRELGNPVNLTDLVARVRAIDG